MTEKRSQIRSFVERGAPQRCVYCHSSFEAEPLQVCELCQAAVHRVCRDELASCPTLGCAQSDSQGWNLDCGCRFRTVQERRLGLLLALSAVGIPALGVYAAVSAWMLIALLALSAFALLLMLGQHPAIGQRLIGPRTGLRFNGRPDEDSEVLELSLDLDLLAPMRLRKGTVQLVATVYRGCEPDLEKVGAELVLFEDRAFSEPGLVSVPCRLSLPAWAQGARSLWEAGGFLDDGAFHELMIEVGLDLPSGGVFVASYGLEKARSSSSQAHQG